MVKFVVLLMFLEVSVGYTQGYNCIEVLVLGTFHFGETSDFQEANYDDVLSPKRQREIGEVVNKLALFKPDKIFVENTPEAQLFWDNVFKKYKIGAKLKSPSVLKNEIYQLGIKTARLTGNKNGVICINYTNPTGSENSNSNHLWETFSKEVIQNKPEYPTFFKSNRLAASTFDTYLKQHEAWKSLSLREHLIRMNEEESLRNLQYFNVLAWMDNNTNGIGSELTSLEYFRNLKIVQNLYTHLNNSDERILVIFGAAHAQILKDIFKSQPVLK
ncbi:MAG: hypothetical protein ACI8UX_000896 [Psychromonas sp.]|jgi:hypothetical protein